MGEGDTAEWTAPCMCGMCLPLPQHARPLSACLYACNASCHSPPAIAAADLLVRPWLLYPAASPPADVNFCGWEALETCYNVRGWDGHTPCCPALPWCKDALHLHPKNLHQHLRCLRAW